MNGQNFKMREENIQHEWKLNTPEKLRSKDKNIVNILTNKKYNLPLRLPDGKYRINRKQSSLKLDSSKDFIYIMENKQRFSNTHQKTQFHD